MPTCVDDLVHFPNVDLSVSLENGEEVLKDVENIDELRRLVEIDFEASEDLPDGEIQPVVIEPWADVHLPVGRGWNFGV